MAKRTERLEIRLTPREKADLREQADTEGMTITELVVHQCLRHPEDKWCRYCGLDFASMGGCECIGSWHPNDELTPLDVTVAQIEEDGA
jgi:hypothetical protein